MSRNLRNRDHPAPNPVDSYPVAPDYFNTDGSYDASAEYAAETYKEFRATHPYKEGDVVWVEYTDLYEGAWSKRAIKAYIEDVFVTFDPDGFPRAKYRIFLALKNGKRFAKLYTYTWPGYIERGYRFASEGKVW